MKTRDYWQSNATRTTLQAATTLGAMATKSSSLANRPLNERRQFGEHGIIGSEEKKIESSGL